MSPTHRDFKAQNLKVPPFIQGEEEAAVKYNVDPKLLYTSLDKKPTAINLTFQKVYSRSIRLPKAALSARAILSEVENEGST